MKQTHWDIPANLLNESISIMRPHGSIGNEGLALWFGTNINSHVTITHLIEVNGPGFITSPLYMKLSLKAMIALTDLTEKLNTSLVGQIHSHPGLLLDLSELDKKHGIRTQNYLSVVCPYYAQRNLNNLIDCGVHVFERTKYRKLPANEVSQRLIVNNSSIRKIKCEVPA